MIERNHLTRSRVASFDDSLIFVWEPVRNVMKSLIVNLLSSQQKAISIVRANFFFVKEKMISRKMSSKSQNLCWGFGEFSSVIQVIQGDSSYNHSR